MVRTITPYTQDKIDKLTGLIELLNQRQRDIQKEMHRTDSDIMKNELNRENFCNSAVLRIAQWYKKVLQGKPIQARLKGDREFPRWMRMHWGFEIRPFLQELLGLEDKICFGYYGVTRSVKYYKYCSQCSLGKYIVKYLFGESGGGLLGMMEDGTERSVWMDTFDNLEQSDWEYYQDLFLKNVKESKG